MRVREALADAARLRPHVERREQQRARAGAKVEDALGPLPVLEMLDRGGDQHLGIGTRDENAGTDVKVDVPEGAAAGDVGDRLALCAPIYHCPEPFRHVTVRRRE